MVGDAVGTDGTEVEGLSDGGDVVRAANGNVEGALVVGYTDGRSDG